MNMENMQIKKEERISVKEGGLEIGIETMRSKIANLSSMIDQIEKLQKVPHGYKNIADEGVVDSNHLPALDQTVEYRGTYDNLQSKSNESLDLSYQAILQQLTLLRDMTGIHSEEETMKFDKDTGRQEKDKN
ncbi:MAG: hypothetical protein WC011_01310 [Candidatus Paceibacterota bacterium]